VVNACEQGFKELLQGVAGIRGRLWIKVQNSPQCGWHRFTHPDNCQLLQTLAEQAENAGLAVGVQTSNYDWNSIPAS
jgi:hypothetical protein